MNRRAKLLITLAGAAYCAYLAAPVLWASDAPAAKAAAETGHQDARSELSVLAGRSVLLDCATPVERVAVGLSTVAEAVAVSPTEIMVNGKAAGETTLILWEKGGAREFFNVSVKPSKTADNDRLDSIRRTLRSELPGQSFKLTSENGSIFLSGTANDLYSAQRAIDITAVGGKVVNLLSVQVPAPQPQILLKVVFAAVDRSRSNQLGVNLFSTGFGNTIGSVSTGQFSPPVVDAAGTKLSDDLNIMAFSKGLNLGATIKALETKGLVEVLAEPNVLAENGKQGSFLAGGEYPYPVVQASGSGSGTSITIMFKEYGIRLNFIPTITPSGDIHLQVAPEVSSLDFTNAVQINGFTVPAIAVRRVKTEVELSKGQSFAIGGLLDNRETQSLQKVPYISNIPVLGKLFQSISKTHSNTELIVIVTPEVVHPTGPIAKPNFPEAFLPPNSSTPMHTPEDAPGTPSQPAPATIPMEKLLESLKPETPLVDDDSTTRSGMVSSGGSSSH